MEGLPCIKYCGDSAVTIEFENQITLEVNHKVIALQMQLAKEEIPGLIETVPTYRSLMVHYDPCICSYEALCQNIQKAVKSLDCGITAKKNIISIPVLYGGDFGPDLDAVAAFEQTTPDEVIRRHTAHECYVYMLGFSPGNAYIGSEKRTFSVPRKPTPRLKIPKGAITIWESQTTIFPMEQPGGWNVIGNTPLNMFHPDADHPFYLKSGDWVHFRSIGKTEYEQIAKQVENGTYQPELIGQGVQ